MPPCTILRLSFIAPANADNGSSSSVLICPAMLWCDFPICSVSPRTVSNATRSDPASVEPNGLRARASNFRAYSSSIAALAVRRLSAWACLWQRQHTTIVRFQLIASQLRILHSLNQRLNTRIIFAPEVIGKTDGHRGAVAGRSQHRFDPVRGPGSVEDDEGDKKPVSMSFSHP